MWIALTAIVFFLLGFGAALIVGIWLEAHPDRRSE